MIRFPFPTDEQLRELVLRQTRSVRLRESDIPRIIAEISSSSFADAERVCMDLRKSCALRGDRNVESADLDDALTRAAYRRDLLSGTAHGAPLIDQG